MIRDIKRASLSELQAKLGSKMGQTLYHYARGIDTRSLETRKPRQSVSAEVNVSQFLFLSLNLF
jgi:DNA repair protein REV1